MLFELNNIFEYLKKLLYFLYKDKIIGNNISCETIIYLKLKMNDIRKFKI